MAIRSTMTFKRPNTSVSWHEPLKDSDTLKNYWQTNFVDTGKITSFNVTDSEDNLTRTMVTVFGNSAANIEFQKDSTMSAMLNTRYAYNIDNRISIDNSDEEI